MLRLLELRLRHFELRRLDGRAAGKIRRDDRRLHLPFHLLVDDRPEDDIDIGIRLLADIARRVVDIEQTHGLIARKVQDDAARALERLIEERAFHRLLDRLLRILRAADAEQRVARLTLREDRRDIREIHIDDARLEDQLRDAPDGLLQHGIRELERLHERDFPILGELHEIVIVDGEQSIHIALHLQHPRFREPLLARALERERQRHHADGEHTELLGDLRNHRHNARAGSRAHTGRDEHEIGTGESLFDPPLIRLRRLLAHLEIAAGAASVRDRRADLQACNPCILEHCKLLGIRIDRDELDVLDVLRMDEITLRHTQQNAVATAANADHLYLHTRSLERRIICHHQNQTPLSLLLYLIFYSTRKKRILLPQAKKYQSLSRFLKKQKVTSSKSLPVTSPTNQKAIQHAQLNSTTVRQAKRIFTASNFTLFHSPPDFCFSLYS